ncbi:MULTISPECIES: nucleotidyltransferase family protein [Cytobacillus]|uniref:Nucleotidyltransferase family protein n=1 Tax=Cytobacillus stercorigallinarum TaxID=2762240 RepID=A0ABR8QMW8_9BACI|nr:nucleotidyltransferase family protein [Cytobacillus stercorigallinarum]MBD7936868.1 nucleotidyltransferase family protein [Cytobacillus stercorigallinarum]
MIRNEGDILQLIRDDEEMMAVLKAVKQLQLPDWWICAGFVRSKVWDTLHHFQERTQLPDVDVIYYDNQQLNENIEKQYEKKLHKILPHIPWSVKNEARMHSVNSLPPYRSSEDAIAKFPETATAIGVKLDSENQLVITAPWGIEDLIHLRIKPTPFFAASRERMQLYESRMISKGWNKRWHFVQ